MSSGAAAADHARESDIASKPVKGKRKATALPIEGPSPTGTLTFLDDLTHLLDYINDKIKLPSITV